MMTNAELVLVLAFSQNYKLLKTIKEQRTLSQLCEKVNLVEAKLEEELSAMKGTLDRLSVVVLGKILLKPPLIKTLQQQSFSLKFL